MAARAPFLPTRSRTARLRDRTCVWPGQSSTVLVAEPLSLARAEPPSVGLVVEAPSLAHVAPPCAVQMADAPSLAGATTEASGMAPEGATGMAVGGHTA
jgi:hypothetical protein